MRNWHRNRSGFTLIELMLVVLMTAVLASAMSFAYATALKAEEQEEAERTTVDHTATMERQMTQLIEGIKISTSATDTTTYFQGVNDGGNSPTGCDRITFTTTAPGVPEASQNDQDDFQTQQTTRGPVGGLAEVSIGLTPIGNAGSQTGIFERIQRPSDSDPTQGGMEFDLDPDVTTLGFQFWDGTEWQPAWDTTTGRKILPQAVQVTYTLKGDTGNNPHQFVVTIPTSTVNPETPDPNGSAAS